MKRTFAFSMILASSTFFATPQIAKAACETGRPDCNTLGYTQSSTDCSGKATLPCPFPTTDTNKYFCGNVVSSCSYTYTAANGGYGPSCKNSSGTTVYQNKCTGIAESNCSNTFAATCISGNGTRYGLCVEATGGGSTPAGCSCSSITLSTQSNIADWCGGGATGATHYFGEDFSYTGTSCNMLSGDKWTTTYGQSCSGCNSDPTVYLHTLETADSTSINRIDVKTNLKELYLRAPTHITKMIETDYTYISDYLTHNDIIAIGNSTTPQHSFDLGRVEREPGADSRHIARINLAENTRLIMESDSDCPFLCIEFNTGDVGYVNGTSPTQMAGATNYVSSGLNGCGNGSYYGGSQLAIQDCEYHNGVFICRHGYCNGVISQLNLDP